MSSTDTAQMCQERQAGTDIVLVRPCRYDHTAFSVALFAYVEQKGTGMRWLL